MDVISMMRVIKLTPNPVIGESPLPDLRVAADDCSKSCEYTPLINWTARSIVTSFAGVNKR